MSEHTLETTRRFTARTALLVVALGLPVAGHGQDQASPAAAPEPAFKLNAFASAAYSYNLNEPDSGLNQFRVFDFNDNSIRLDVAEVVLQRTVPNAGNLGFRVDLTAGGSIPRVAAASGLFRDPATGEAEDFDLQQAFASWNAPLGHGLRLDFGKFVTHFGYEVIEGYDGWNDNYSRSLLFGYTIPFTHTGLKATYAGEKASFAVMVVNGWDNVKDNNDGKSVGANLTLTPSKSLSLYFNWMGGPEQVDRSNRRNVWNGIAVIKPGSRVVLAADYVYGREDDSVGTGVPARWQGVAGYLRLNPSERVGLTLRGEWFDDEDGVRTGTVQALKEISFTPEVKISGGFLLRGEVRYDKSDANVFEKAGTLTDTQTTLALNAIYSF
jgi:Putative beta-barrel porin-2, OmpL-like. bbp2